MVMLINDHPEVPPQSNKFQLPTGISQWMFDESSVGLPLILTNSLRMEMIMILMVIEMIIKFSFYIASFVQCIHNLLWVLYKAKIKIGVKIMFCRILLLIIIARGLIRYYLPCIVTFKAVYWCADQTNLLTKHVYPTSRPDDGAICSSLNSTPQTAIIISFKNIYRLFTQIWKSPI